MEMCADMRTDIRADMHACVSVRACAFATKRCMLFLTTFRGMPTANAEGSIRTVSVRRVFGCLEIDAGPTAFAVGMAPRHLKKLCMRVAGRNDAC